MCGIVGFTGAAQAAPILLDGLAKLEYRGYDSAGIAVENAAGKIEVVKAKGRLRVLSEMTDGGSTVPGSCGIGHTRWATHGEPSVVNAHPHYSRDQKIAVVHNGIIENFQELKDRLTARGFTFTSQTDTEVAAQMIDYYYTGESAGDPLDAITRMMLHVRGSYALGVLFADQPGVIYAVRKDSPLIVGRAENGSLIASDVPALLKYTRTVYYIDNLEIARLTPDSIEFFNIDKEPIEKTPSTVEWDAEAAEKGGFEHFMMKEIHEQPAAVRETLSPRIKDGRIDLSEVSLDGEAIRAVRRLYIIGCGSAYHVGVAARYVFERPGPPAGGGGRGQRVPLPRPGAGGRRPGHHHQPERRDRRQPGRLRECKARGVRTLGIVNVVGSSIAREADAVLYTWAGPEIAVATTKAYSTQLAAVYLLATEFGRVRGVLEEERYAALVQELEALPGKIEKTLADKERIQWFASKYAAAKDAFFIGRGPGLRRGAGGQPEVQGDQLHPLGGVCRRRDEARPHLSGGEGHAGGGHCHPARPVRKDHLQHGGGQKPGRFPDGADQLRQLQHRGHRRLYRLRAPHRPPLCHQPGGHPAAAAGLLCQLRQGPGCGQTPQSGQERDGGISRRLWHSIQTFKQIFVQLLLRLAGRPPGKRSELVL